jgi:lantibiotic modifying enzyme
MTSHTASAMRASTWRDTALGLAEILADEAIAFDDMYVFHGASAGDRIGAPPVYRTMGGDVYEGSAGIARFLGAAAIVGNDSRLRTVALGAMRHAIGHASHHPDNGSLQCGSLGIALVALSLSDTLDAPEFRADAVRLIDRACDDAGKPDAPGDYLVGTAGTIAGLLAVAHHGPAGRWTSRAFELGRLLLGQAVVVEPADAPSSGLSWPLTPGHHDHLCGLAHGASGMALAFEALALHAENLIERERWRDAARRARNFERRHYSDAHGSWADLRSGEHGEPVAAPVHPHMWCHGSVGVVAERLHAMAHDPLARADAVGGLAGARAYAGKLVAGPAGPGGGDALNGSLCHGLAGLIDLFIDAWCMDGDTGWIALAGELGDLMINDARRAGGWRSGVPGGWPTPGLMLGKAGSGWALLRLSEPERLGSGWRVEMDLGRAISGRRASEDNVSLEARTR